MDSGNSGGSYQSSSGGADEEFDSSQSRPPHPPGDHQNNSAISAGSVFSPPVNFASPNPLFLNPNFSDHSVWPGPIRSQQQQQQQQSYPNFGSLSQQPPPPPRADPDHHHPHLSAVAKNPKKRTRASRRAPTTVLTTDTSNFRQMVQEFTGIPPSPFAAPSSRRLDLFSAPGSLRLGPLYSLRPPINPNTTPTPFLMDSTTLLPPPPNSINPNPAFLLPLQLGGNIPPMTGFPEQESGSRNNNNDGEDQMREWASGETVRSNDGNVGDSGGGYDSNVDSTRHQQRHVSHYNLNLSQKAARENTAAPPPPPPGNVASWMYPSQ